MIKKQPKKSKKTAKSQLLKFRSLADQEIMRSMLYLPGCEKAKVTLKVCWWKSWSLVGCRGWRNAAHRAVWRRCQAKFEARKEKCFHQNFLPAEQVSKNGWNVRFVGSFFLWNNLPDLRPCKTPVHMRAILHGKCSWIWAFSWPGVSPQGVWYSFCFLDCLFGGW